MGDDIFDEEKNVKKEEKREFRYGVGVDVGTSNIVVTRQTKDGTFINKFHRNMLFPMDISDESTDLLEKSNYLYVKSGNKVYVVGEDAISLCNALGGKNEIIRPMQDGLLNPALKDASDLLFYIIKAVVGEPLCPNECLRFCIPANAIDKDSDNIFHKMILTNFFKKLGYNAKPINEAMAVAFSENPKVKSEDEVYQLSGVSLSAGAGMTNLALLFKGMELGTFSITKSGDYIDEQAAKVTGVPKSKITKRKEKELDLENVDHKDRVLSALSIYYSEYVSRVAHLIAQEFTKRSSEIAGEAEVVVAGGTSMPKGFIKIFEDSLREQEFPFKIARVRASENPFFSVANGCCIRALSDTQKQEKQK
jgi:actin-like ATPase involved in cell morphogenesis